MYGLTHTAPRQDVAARPSLGEAPSHSGKTVPHTPRRGAVPHSGKTFHTHQDEAPCLTRGRRSTHTKTGRRASLGEDVPHQDGAVLARRDELLRVGREEQRAHLPY
eukprot:2103789-Prymnesium_polylepis.1